MRNFALFFLFVLLFVTAKANAQAVCGIDIRTTKTKYVSAITKSKRGFANPKKSQNKYLYEGVKFADIDGCEFSLHFNSETDSITLIRIRFPHKSYNDDVDMYVALKQQLVEKYGEGEDLKLAKMLRSNTSTKGFSQYDWKEPNISLQHRWNKLSKDPGDNYVVLMYLTGVQSSKKTQVSPDL